MSIRIVRLGSPRAPSEGLRIGTVRRPPRGVAKADFSSGNWYDVWFPNLAPSPGTMQLGLTAVTEKDWARFAKKFRTEMKAPGPTHDLALLATLSRTTNFSIGCYCEREERCHRSILRDLLLREGAEIA